jgi:hypothetical protein
MMKESVGDMSMLYDLCTVDLYQDSSWLVNFLPFM